VGEKVVIRMVGVVALGVGDEQDLTAVIMGLVVLEYLDKDFVEVMDTLVVIIADLVVGVVAHRSGEKMEEVIILEMGVMA